ncbi:glycosyltransferase family 2 protein [Fulvivirgaceae bacterium PWU5]|uniref:Glycosyltransferase family 2 protein n=1 Tax=Dawidia cretensis TaxID=2782350 RepID=A0AAP2E4K1_9BACT|nr:glycosyltransferase family 2 protein [Dawidia cretensis]MBT1712128.1 glycosyltransferase family 2 protein [Dawidia cretensis]
MTEISIVIPVYNEEETIPELYTRLLGLLTLLNEKFAVSNDHVEFIFVNDGSKDNTLQSLISVTQQHASFKVINLSRNFGHQIAVTAGIEMAVGNAVVLIDADLQDPPEFIIDLYAKYKEGYDVVYAVRQRREGENFFKLATAKMFYRIMQRITNMNIPLDTGDFRIMGRNVVDVINSMKEKHRFIRGMVTWVGFKQTGLLYHRKERFAGQSKYPLIKMMRFAWDGITAFSTSPLRMVSYLGFTIATVGFLYCLYVIYAKIFTNETIQGWASVMIVTLIMSGINLITLGVIGQYIGRISEESKNRPLYIIDKIYQKNVS